MEKTYRWGYAEIEYDYDVEDGEGAVWIENKFLSIYNKNVLPIGKYSLEWDGVPYWIISFGIFAISFGKIGRWIMLKKSIECELPPVEAGGFLVR